MKYYRQQGYGCIVIQFEDNSLEVYTLDGYKFISPQWYTKELLPILEEISQKDFENNREYILEEETCEKDDFEKIDLDCFPIPVLYHGTDKKILRMTEDERISYKSSCLKIIDYFYPLFKKLKHNSAWDLTNSGLDKETELNLYKIFNHLDSYKNDNPWFQYPNNIIYLSSSESQANDYSNLSFAGGEIGYNAYYLCKAATHSFYHDLNLGADMEAAVKRVLEFGNREKEPTVIPFDNLELKYLRNEDGTLLTEFGFNLLTSYRYLAPLHFDI